MFTDSDYVVVAYGRELKNGPYDFTMKSID